MKRVKQRLSRRGALNQGELNITSKVCRFGSFPHSWTGCLPVSQQEGDPILKVCYQEQIPIAEEEEI
jgi:hypothetical protein